MVVTRSMSATTKNPGTKIRKVAERARKKTTDDERASRQTMMKERKEAFLKQFREQYPDVEISPKVMASGEQVWLSMTANDNVADFEKRLALDLVLEAFTKDLVKEVNRAKPGTTDERESKKTTAERALVVKRMTGAESYITESSHTFFMMQTFKPQFAKKYPNMLKIDPFMVIEAEEKAWSAMSASAKAPYIAQAVKQLADKIASVDACRKMYGLPRLKQFDLRL